MSNFKFKYSDLSTKSVLDLREDLLSLKKTLLQSRFSVVMKDIKDISIFKKTKRAIARINTEISSRGERF